MCMMNFANRFQIRFLNKVLKINLIKYSSEVNQKLPINKSLTFVQSRRVNALEKILLKHICNITGTSFVNSQSLNKLPIQEVKIVNNRKFIVVNWLSTNDCDQDSNLENLLPIYSKHLRQKLIDLHITSIIPPILFVKSITNLSDNQNLRSDCIQNEAKNDKNLDKDNEKKENNDGDFYNGEEAMVELKVFNPYGLNREALVKKILEKIKPQPAQQNHENVVEKVNEPELLKERRDRLGTYLKDCKLERKKLHKLQQRDFNRCKRDMLTEKL